MEHLIMELVIPYIEVNEVVWKFRKLNKYWKNWIKHHFPYNHYISFSYATETKLLGKLWSCSIPKPSMVLPNQWNSILNMKFIGVNSENLKQFNIYITNKKTGNILFTFYKYSNTFIQASITDSPYNIRLLLNKTLLKDLENLGNLGNLGNNFEIDEFTVEIYKTV